MQPVHHDGGLPASGGGKTRKKMKRPTGWSVVVKTSRRGRMVFEYREPKGVPHWRVDDSTPC